MSSITFNRIIAETKYIFLDLDDVLNTCTPAALHYVGCPVSPTDITVQKPEWGYDIVNAANRLHPTKLFTESTFWQSIGRDFWANAPKSIECDWLLETCAGLVGRERVCILTAPTLDPDCLAGKLEWIQRCLPKWIHRQYLMGPRKHFCAKRGALLIDDNPRNIEAFSAHGGLTILMPRPWNYMHAVTDSLGYVAKRLGVKPPLREAA